MVCSNIMYLIPPKYVNLVFLLSQGLHLSLQSPGEKDGDGTKDNHSTGCCIEESLVLVEGETMVGPELQWGRWVEESKTPNQIISMRRVKVWKIIQVMETAIIWTLFSFLLPRGHFAKMVTLVRQ